MLSICLMGVAIVVFCFAGGMALIAGVIDELMASSGHAGLPVGELSWAAARWPLLWSGPVAALSAVALAAAWIYEGFYRRDISAWSEQYLAHLSEE